MSRDLERHRNAFWDQGYCVVREAISRDAADIAAKYALFNRLHEGHYSHEPEFNALGRYVDVLGEAMLVQLQPLVEAVSGFELHPTCSYLRIYQNGAVLPRHVDRKSCEVSASMTLGFAGAEMWPFFVGAGTELRLDPGDFVVYRGAKLPHWRDAFGGEYWIQLFLHYISAGGEFSHLKYDRRTAIGAPAGDIRAESTGRNDPCTCGSGLKFKNCHGKLDG